MANKVRDQKSKEPESPRISVGGLLGYGALGLAAVGAVFAVGYAHELHGERLRELERKTAELRGRMDKFPEIKVVTPYGTRRGNMCDEGLEA